MIIAIDGPAASGKSSIAKLLAKRIGFIYFGTGIMYRAITAYIIKNNLIDNLSNFSVDKINNICIDLDKNNLSEVLINGKDYSNYYYNKKNNKYVSIVSSISDVRNKMVDIQRKISKNNNIICEGRDIGTIVFPNAKFKYFLEATIECRAKRRFNELNSNLEKLTIEEIKKMLYDRDQFDINRTISPLKKANDAILINTTNMTINQVVDFLFTRIRGSI